MRRIAAWTALLIMVGVGAFSQQKYTRGVGIYPGDPAQDFAPALAPDTINYRNLALLRPAYHSSSYDYNLTAQLVTDGIRETALPHWLVTTTSQSSVAKKNEREFLVDHNSTSTVNLGEPNAWVQFELAGGDAPFEIDRIDIEASLRPKRSGAPGASNSAQQNASPGTQQAGLGEWSCTVVGSDNGQIWYNLGLSSGTIPPPPRPVLFGPTASPIKPSVSLFQPSRRRFFRIALQSTAEGAWVVNDVAFFNKKQPVEVGGPYNFSSSWMSEGTGEEWIYVDLGARCTFDRVVLYWIRRAAEGVIQVSDNAAKWKDIQPFSSATGFTDDFKLKSPMQGRYVRVLMKQPASPEGYILSELEVYGRGGPIPKHNAGAAPFIRADGALDLAGSAWRLQRDSLVNADGVALSKPGFQDAGWLPATVPATVLSSYWNAGALPDPNYGQNQLMISDSFFYADFWYRTEFTAPNSFSNRKVWLNFDGINWKAEVFLNGEELGRIEGAFMRGRFDVTEKIRPKGKNALAIRIKKNATPGSAKQKTLETAGLNGGALGADNPTYHASIGWDWDPHRSRPKHRHLERCLPF